MPNDKLGQMISFSTESERDIANADSVWVTVTKALNEVKKIVAARGHPELAQQIATLNGIRSPTQKLRVGRRIRIPGTLQQRLSFDVHIQDAMRPQIKDGYAAFDVVNRPGITGLTHFKGYAPLAMDVPISFEGYAQAHNDWHRDPPRFVVGPNIEDKIRKLERMAGRGPGFASAASGPPAIIRVSVTDNNGSVVPLIPLSYQWNDVPGVTKSHGAGILWRINGIDWADGVLSDPRGNRVRADAVVHLFQYTPIYLIPGQGNTMVQRAKAGSTRGGITGNRTLGGVGPSWGAF